MSVELQPGMTRFTSHGFPPPEQAAARRRPRSRAFVAPLALLCATFVPGMARAQDTSFQARQYQLSPAQPRRYPQPVYQPARPVSSNGGIFGFLFGAPDPDRYRRRGGYGPGGGYSYSPAPADGGGGYTTMCVRLCDGYYWPLSYSTGSEGLRRDANRCESSCGSPSRLFYHYASDKAENMVDLEGHPYAGLENAFRYRTVYDSSCRCKPEPWSEAAKEDYARRAELAESGRAAREEVAQAPEAVNPRVESPRPYAATGGRAPRQRRRILESFNPFGRWFN